MKELKQFNDCLARIKQGEQLFLLQLEWDQFPSQEWPEDLYDNVEQKFVQINALFTEPVIDTLQRNAADGDVSSSVLLGQYFYIRPYSDLTHDRFYIIKDEVLHLNSKVEVRHPDKSANYEATENIFEVRKRCGESLSGCRYTENGAKTAIERLHNESANYFIDAYEAGSVLAMYYLAKHWESQIQAKYTPEIIKEKFDSQWSCGLVSETKCGLKSETIHMIKALISNICLSKANSELEKSRNDVISEKKQTEDLMQWIAHSTNSDLTSLELAVEREHAANSQVLTQKIRHDMETFSLISSDSESFVNAVKQDVVGSITLHDVVCESMISTMLFMLSPKARDQKLMNHRYFDYAQHKMGVTGISRKDWVNSAAFPLLQKELFTEFLSIKDDVDKVLLWIGSHFGDVKLKIDERVQLTMSEHGKKSVVLAYIFKQFINNAIKYGAADATQSMLSIQCRSDSEWYYLIFSNKISQSRMQKGNNKGLDAMNMMLSKLRQSKLDISDDGCRFMITCKLDRDLIGG